MHLLLFRLTILSNLEPILKYTVVRILQGLLVISIVNNSAAVKYLNYLLGIVSNIPL